MSQNDAIGERVFRGFVTALISWFPVCKEMAEMWVFQLLACASIFCPEEFQEDDRKLTT
jgi:hypothetical protein